MNSIPVITASNTDTFNNNIIVESPDLIDGDICVPYPVVSFMYAYVKHLVDLPACYKATLTAMGKDETTIKRVLLIDQLMDKQPASWCSKDADLMAFVVGLIFFMCKSKQTVIEKIMFGMCDKLLDETVSGERSEVSYKNQVDIIMRLKNMLKELDRVKVGIVYPRGSWINFQGNIILKLSYY